LGPGAAAAGCRGPATAAAAAEAEAGAGAIAAMPKLLTPQGAPAKPAPPAALHREISQ